jgi:hypothetical protein
VAGAPRALRNGYCAARGRIGSDPIFRPFEKWGLTLIFAVAPVWAGESAKDTAFLVLRHLSEGNIAEAAALSNSPRRRFEVLSDYRDRVGEEEFKRVFTSYLSPENRLIAEVVRGKHTLLVWKLAEADDHIAAQYYVEIEGKFLLDDVPSPGRAELTRELRRIRAKN